MLPEFKVTELPSQAEKIPGLYALIIVIIGLGFLGTLAGAIFWGFEHPKLETPGWMISIVSVLGGGLLGALLPKGSTPSHLIQPANGDGDDDTDRGG